MPETANTLAQVALFLWIPISLSFFYIRSPEVAAGWVIISGFLFLPELVAISVPGAPPIDKGRVATLCVWVGCLLRAPKGYLSQNRLRGGYSGLFWLGVLAPVATVLLNGDDLIYGKSQLAGLGLPDIRISALLTVLDVILPFWLAHALFRTPEQLRGLVQTIFRLGLIYTPLALSERIKGPWLNPLIYGYNQHDFFQTLRSGGFRPMVFTSHGITLAKFFVCCIILGLCLSRQKSGGLIEKLKAGYVYAVLSVSNSLGALLYSTVFGPISLLSSAKLQALIGQVLALALLVVPVLRYSDAFPVTEMVQSFEGSDASRASSLSFRFMNEDMLLEKFSERPWFGFGGNARNRVFSADGKDISVTDGDWVIILGIGGVFGFIAYFGPAILAVFRARGVLARIREHEDQLLLGAMSLALGIWLVDSIPNSLAGLPLNFLAGALAGVIDAQQRPTLTQPANPRSLG